MELIVDILPPKDFLKGSFGSWPAEIYKKENLIDL